MNPHIEALKEWLADEQNGYSNHKFTPDQLAALRAAIEDMERMEWLEQQQGFEIYAPIDGDAGWQLGELGSDLYDGLTLREAIDAARNKEGGNQ